MRSFGTKLALIGTTAVVGLTMFATVALAAPTLSAGQTSGPHNSRGTCTECHSYKSAPAPAPAPAQAPSTSGAPTAPAAPAAGQPLITITIYGPAGAQTIAIGQSSAAPTAAAPDSSTTSSGDAEDGDDD